MASTGMNRYMAPAYLAVLEVGVLELDRRTRARGAHAPAVRRSPVLDVDSVHDELGAVAEGEDLGSIRRNATAPAAAQGVLRTILGRDRDRHSSRFDDGAIGDGDVAGELHGRCGGKRHRLLQADLVVDYDSLEWGAGAGAVAGGTTWWSRW